jgi:MoaA/NifB/PqqE/SkfB family radical SAM enzyme
VLSGGEALLHSQLWELCDALRAAGIGITLLSTGLLLRRHASDLVRRCDDVVVSLDGPQPIHDTIRNVPRAFDRLADGVAAVKSADSAVRVTARCTVQRANHAALRATTTAARRMGLDGISFLAAHVSSEAVNRPDGWAADRTRQVALDAGDVAALANEIEALVREHADDFASGFIAESPQKLRRRLSQYYAALLGDADFFPNDCNAPWVSSVIESDGTVRPCFFHAPLGKIGPGQSLSDIVNSPAAVAWRAELDVRTNPGCRRCVCTLSRRDTREMRDPTER